LSCYTEAVSHFSFLSEWHPIKWPYHYLFIMINRGHSPMIRYLGSFQIPCVVSDSSTLSPRIEKGTRATHPHRSRFSGGNMLIMVPRHSALCNNAQQLPTHTLPADMATFPH
jgi:hypothetical protein